MKWGIITVDILATASIHAFLHKPGRIKNTETTAGICSTDSEQWIGSEECNVIVTFVRDGDLAMKNLDFSQWGWHCTNWAICQP
jgi:hypothetical protein